MTTKLKFTTLDVFTTTRFLGNPLAIVHVPPNTPLTQSQKQTIAREFNLSETVFLHEAADTDADTDTDSGSGPVRIDIFTVDKELPFAGHPSIGSGWYLLSQQASGRDTVTLKTKAGEIPVVRDLDTKGSGGVKLQVPIQFKIHEPYTDSTLKSPHLQPNLTSSSYTNGLSGPEAVASIVKGMTFILLQVTSEAALAALEPYHVRFEVAGLGEWAGFVGVYAFFEEGDGVVRTRMFEGRGEDPATGSAASTLGGWLGVRKGQGKWAFRIVQGVEMGRRSEILVGVDVGGEGQVERIELGGEAVEVMQGWVNV